MMNTTQAAQATMSFDQKKQLCIGWLRNQFQAYQQGGGKESLQAWLQPQVVQVLQAEKIPYTLESSAQTKTPTGSPRAASVKETTPALPPPSEPGLVSEGLGPLEWIFWAREIAVGGLEGAGKVLGEFVVEEVVDNIDDWLTDPVPTTLPSGPGDGDGSVGTSPGVGSGLTGDDGGGDVEGGGDGLGDPSHDTDPGVVLQ